MTTTLEQFRAQRKELTSHREAADRWPTKAESAEIESRALAAGIQRSALVDVFEAYIGDPKTGRDPEFDLNSMSVWLDEQRITRTHLWPNASVGVYALAAKAFSENGVLDLGARGALVSELGIERADEMAKSWGLSSIHDTKTKGVRPAAASESLAGKIRELESDIAKKTAELNAAKRALPMDTNKPTTNPFNLLTRADGTRDPAIEKRIGDMIVAMGTQRVAQIAASGTPPRRLDGTPIPAKWR